MSGDEPIVLVDARNVLRSRWPNIAEAKLVALCSAWAERERCCAVLVFDGEAPDLDAGPRCTVRGTRGESADAAIAREAAALRAAGIRFWLVTSDRALRADAGRGAERTIGGGTFAHMLTEAR